MLLTSHARLADAPGNVRVAAREAGLPRESVANVSQVFTVDKMLLTEHAGQVRSATLARIADGLRLVLEL